MRIIFVLFLAIFAFAFDVKILSVNNDYAKIDSYIKKGISGDVICTYDKTPIICAKAVAFGNIVKFYNYTELKNDAFALPQVSPKPGDKIILGKNYRRILIIVPNQNAYIKTAQLYKGNTIISPDIFAPFIDEMPTREDFEKFCNDMNIGRIIFVLDKIYEVDSFSFYAIKKRDIDFKAKYDKAFFVTFPSFKITGKNIEQYYKSLIKE
ncbi:plasminogen-binding N-terminal domain-containing protein [Caminibacter pacificus]